MKHLWVVIGILALLVNAATLLAQGSPTTKPAWEAELEALTARLADVPAVSGSFTQHRYTPMLRQPLVSSGKVSMAGALMRWDTEKPSSSVLLITPSDARVYLPDQSLLEIYRVDAQAMGLAGSPAPRLDKLREQFELSPAPAAAPDLLAIILRPREAGLKEHVSEVQLQIDRNSAFLRQMVIVNPDGERQVTDFQDMKIRRDLKEKDLQLAVPKNTRASVARLRQAVSHEPAASAAAIVARSAPGGGRTVRAGPRRHRHRRPLLDGGSHSSHTATAAGNVRQPGLACLRACPHRHHRQPPPHPSSWHAGSRIAAAWPADAGQFL
jgi:outer membrane lipoprotein-sorting protein